MRRCPRCFGFTLLVLLLPQLGWGQTEVRVATYNIKFLDADKLPGQAPRRDSLLWEDQP